MTDTVASEAAARRAVKKYWTTCLHDRMNDVPAVCILILKRINMCA